MINEFLPFYLQQQLLSKNRGTPLPTGIIYPDGEVAIGNVTFVDIMLRREPTAISANLYQQVVDWFDNCFKIRIDLTHANSNGTYTFTIWKWNYDNSVGRWERIGHIGSFQDKIMRNNRAIEEALKLI